MKNKEKIKNYVSYSLAGIIILWFISFIYEIESIIVSLLWISATIFNFVNSIRYIKYSKGLGITSLCISGFLLLLFLIGFSMVIMEEVDENEIYYYFEDSFGNLVDGDIYINEKYLGKTLYGKIFIKEFILGKITIRTYKDEKKYENNFRIEETDKNDKIIFEVNFSKSFEV